MAEQIRSVLVDDDEIVRLTWEMSAKAKKINLSVFASMSELLRQVSGLSKEATFYIDFYLKEETGNEVVKKLDSLGFKNFYLISGDKDVAASPLFLKKLSKDPPWL
jgi:FixJ family two-component response regulator